ncbi:putative DNA binding domain-containing protein [Candidatus Parcubacteria bacterium]|nr:putative DNA binding domain-containing protein [Candidatus Parcubacteria bacterium]
MNNKELDFILQEGEGQFVEFKEGFNKFISKEIVAFANASGGKIFLGISDDGKLKGIKTINKLKSQIQDLVRNCEPSINITLSEFNNLLIIDIKEGKDKPYSCPSGFYLRIGSNSQKMKRDEILKLATKGGKIRFDEQICKEFNWKDFDMEKFEHYLKLSGISNNLDKKDILRNLKILTDEGFTNAGVLFFAKEPYKYIGNSKIRCVHFMDDERVKILDKKEVDGGVIGNIEFAVNYLKERVPVEFVIKKLAREEYPDYPIDAYREVVVNAVVHRDYFESAEIAVEKLKNSIIINNPGGLLFEKERFGKFSFYRNRLIADLLSKTIYMEKSGTGINRIKKFCRENGNSVKFDFDSFCFFTTINKKERASERLGEKEGEKEGERISQNQRKILFEIGKNKFITSKELVQKIEINEKNIEKNIANLKKQGLLKRVGSAKGGHWEVSQ